MRPNAPQNDTDTTMLLAVFLAVVVIVGLWATFHEEVATVVVTVMGAQARLIARLGVTDYLDGVLQFLQQTPPSAMEPAHLEQISRYVGTVTRWVLSPLLLILALMALKWMRSGLFRGPMSFDALLRYQSLKWSAIRPIVTFNPGRQEMPNQSWARALRPLEWLTANHIALDADGNFDPEKVEQAFATQLGEPWEGVSQLPAHLQGMLAAFALAASFSRKAEAEALLSALDMLWAQGRGSQPEQKTRDLVTPLLSDSTLMEAATTEANRHAWVSTVMAALMRKAIDGGGILNSGLFVWLRGVDRRTWYVLNNVGRTTYHIEGAGALCHLMAEDAAGAPIETPNVENAVEGLIEYLYERGKLGA
jgi:hypothetical protein